MNALLVRILLRVLAAGAVAALLYRLFGASGLVFSAPLFGVLLARPLIELGSELKDRARSLAYDEVEGQYYAFKGRRMHVAEDVDGWRWIDAAHLRKVVPGLPADASLLNLYPQGSRRLGRRSQVYLRAETLLEALARSSDPMTLRLRLWVEREIVLPAERRRQRTQRPAAAAPPPAAAPTER